MITREQWRMLVRAYSPSARFVTEDGSGKTYGEKGDITAVVGLDMQADVVGVYTTDNYCWYWNSRARQQVEVYDGVKKARAL